MSPLLAKATILFVLIIAFFLLIVFGYLFYKNVIRPAFLRTFHYRKVLKAAEVILKSQGDSDAKINGLIAANINDLDLIRLAELEVMKSKKIPKGNINKEKIGIIDSIMNLWRKKHGKKKPIRQDSGTEDKGEIRGESRAAEGPEPSDGPRPGTESSDGPRPGTEPSTEPEPGPGPGPESSEERSIRGGTEESGDSICEVSNGDAEHRPIQSESSETSGRTSKYFS